MLAKGRKPRGTKDFQWQEESLDFPQRYGKFNDMHHILMYTYVYLCTL